MLCYALFSAVDHACFAALAVLCAQLAATVICETDPVLTHPSAFHNCICNRPRSDPPLCVSAFLCPYHVACIVQLHCLYNAPAGRKLCPRRLLPAGPRNLGQRSIIPSCGVACPTFYDSGWFRRDSRRKSPARGVRCMVCLQLMM